MRKMILAAAAAGFAVICGAMHLAGTNPAMFSGGVVIALVAFVFASMAIISIAGTVRR